MFVNDQDPDLDFKGYVKLDEGDSWKKIVDNKIVVNHAEESFMIMMKVFTTVHVTVRVYPLRTIFNPVVAIVEARGGKVEEVRKGTERELFDGGSITISSGVGSSGSISRGTPDSGERKEKSRFGQILDLDEISEEESEPGSDEEGGTATPPRRYRERSLEDEVDSERSTLEKQKKPTESDRGDKAKVPAAPNTTIFGFNNVLLGNKIIEEEVNGSSKKSSAKASPVHAIPNCIICYSKPNPLTIKQPRKSTLWAFCLASTVTATGVSLTGARNATCALCARYRLQG